MGEKDTVNIKTTADLLENEKTEQRKKDAEAIEAKQKEAAEKAEEARREQERKEQELAARKAEQEEQRAREAAAAAEAEAAKAAAETQKEELIGAGLALAGTALAGNTGGKKNSGGFFKGLLLGILIGALGLWFLMPKQPSSPEPAPAAVEDADVTLDNNGILGFTAADFQEAVLSAASEHQELIVMEQPLSITTTITKAGLGNLAIFAKIKEVTYYGTGVYTVDLSGMKEDRILVDEETCTVTVRIPHTVLQYVNPELSKTEFEDTENGLLAFGDLKLTPEETNLLEQSVYRAMEERLDSQDLYLEADRFAELKTWEIFQPLVSAVSPMYRVAIEFTD